MEGPTGQLGGQVWFPFGAVLLRFTPLFSVPLRLQAVLRLSSLNFSAHTLHVHTFTLTHDNTLKHKHTCMAKTNARTHRLTEKRAHTHTTSTHAHPLRHTLFDTLANTCIHINPDTYLCTVHVHRYIDQSQTHTLSSRHTQKHTVIHINTHTHTHTSKQTHTYTLYFK